jgi:hypothetical protein
MNVVFLKQIVYLLCLLKYLSALKCEILQYFKIGIACFYVLDALEETPIIVNLNSTCSESLRMCRKLRPCLGVGIIAVLLFWSFNF